jgi:TRAP-type C4-dicarboxylate transport system substrate-binding protein
MAPKLEDWSAKFLIKLRLEYRKLYKASGIEFIQFSPMDAKKYLDNAYNATKEEFLKKAPKEGPRLLELLTKK